MGDSRRDDHARESAAAALIPTEVPELPLAARQNERGRGRFAALADDPAPPKVVDGAIERAHLGGERRRRDLQHYGVYVPGAYVAGAPSPLQWWLHFRGGKAHTAAAVVPRIMQDFGEDHDTIVVSPRGRGTSTWYVSKGHVDFLEVWDDVHARFSIDPDRVYLTGHSMGGWGTYLMSVLYPDRFAAVMPSPGLRLKDSSPAATFPSATKETMTAVLRISTRAACCRTSATCRSRSSTVRSTSSSRFRE